MEAQENNASIYFDSGTLLDNVQYTFSLEVSTDNGLFSNEGSLDITPISCRYVGDVSS